MESNLTLKIIEAKNDLDNNLKEFLKQYSTENDSIQIQLLINDLLSKHTNVINIINNSIGQTHQEYDFYYNKDIRNDYVATIESFLPVSFKISELIDIIVKKHNLLVIQKTENKYITIQKLINSFSSKENRKKLVNEFTSRNININGFNQKFKRVKNKELRLQLYIGIPLLVASVILIFSGEYFLGKPFNGIQLIMLKALIALTISIVGSSLIEGSVKTNWTIQKGLTIRAIGWVAVFLLIYFLNPANPGDVH